ncbi:uncharacterized protein PV09_07288 [Verruconis gallopava]|uniref:Uncharacterized protein n=1 Tax=Verruconis gallopava TaxID=253628 RepID=A0A0D2A447_9PEZI|nr:uncharacterized protein PV09_07288 [Verruconis gallopava]KIW01245.1 hypothetical protein PV09_07288 [Verruconis gallopava]
MFSSPTDSFSFWKEEEADEDSRYNILDINLVHPIKTTRIAVHELVRLKSPVLLSTFQALQGNDRASSLLSKRASKHGVSSLMRGTAPLEKLARIRVAGVAPGSLCSNTTGTRLYTPEARKTLNLSKDLLVPKEEVANAMFAILIDKSYQSGTIFAIRDIGQDTWRPVELLSGPGPSGPASTTSGKADTIKEIIKHLAPEGVGNNLYEGILTD